MTQAMRSTAVLISTFRTVETDRMCRRRGRYCATDRIQTRRPCERRRMRPIKAPSSGAGNRQRCGVMKQARTAAGRGAGLLASSNHPGCYSTSRNLKPAPAGSLSHGRRPSQGHHQLPSFNSRQLGSGRTLMSPRPSVTPRSLLITYVFFFGFRKRTPGPPPFSSMNSMPAASSAVRSAA